MRTRMLLPLGLAVTALVMLTGSLCAQESPDAGGAAPKPAAPAAAPKAGGVDGIAKAPDPSSAIAAYAQARADAPNDPAVDAAFVKRMVEFGLPEMAEKQARAVTDRDAQNGVAWAVVAYMDAKRDDAPNAIKRISNAAKLAPGDAFVMRTAAQIVAWYDTRADHKVLGDAAGKTIEDVRKSLAGRAEFDEAYGRAKDDYTQTPDSEPAQPPAEEPKLVEPVKPAEPPAEPPDERYVERVIEKEPTYIYYGSDDGYTDPYVGSYVVYSAPAVVYSSWYPSSYWCNSWCGPSWCYPSSCWSSCWSPNWWCGWSSCFWPSCFSSSWCGSGWWGGSSCGSGLSIGIGFHSGNVAVGGTFHTGKNHHGTGVNGTGRNRGGSMSMGGANGPRTATAAQAFGASNALTRAGAAGPGSRSIARQFNGGRGRGGDTAAPFQVAPRTHGAGANARGSQPGARMQPDRASLGAPRTSRSNGQMPRSQFRPQPASPQRPARTSIGLPSAPRSPARPQAASQYRGGGGRMATPSQPRMPQRTQSYAPARSPSRMNSPARMSAPSRVSSPARASAPSRMSSPARSAPSRSGGGGGFGRGGRQF